MVFSKNNSSYFFIGLTGLILLWVNLNIGGTKDYANGLIESDSKGYYAYLPAIFIYHDLNLGFYDSIENHRYYNPNLRYEYRAGHNGKTINKYFIGTAVCLAPFFLTGHLLTLLSDYPADGYSYYYVKSVSVAAVFYLLLSLVFLVKILKKYGISNPDINLSLAGIVFGTNLFYYSVVEFGLSHVYSLFFISMFVYFALQYFHNPRAGYLIRMALCLGMIILIRPLNILVLLALPFLAGSPESFYKGVMYLIRKPAILFIAVLLTLMIVFIQMAVYKLQTGQWMVYSYKGEGFNFCSPQIIPILFSYKKGLFLYTPMYLLSIAGVYFFFKAGIYKFLSWTLFFLVIVYIFSSWHNWYYGGSFSGRVFVEYLPFFAIPLGLALHEINKAWQKACFKALIICLILLCQVQTYQYRHGQIHWSDQTKEKYLENFLRIDKLL